MQPHAARFPAFPNNNCHYSMSRETVYNVPFVRERDRLGDNSLVLVIGINNGGATLEPRGFA